MEVRDRNDLPVSGASVLFLLGDGGTATLNAGVQQVASTTNALGQAAVSVNPVASGAVELTVNATFQGQAASAAITQTNFATAAQAAAAGAGTSGSAAGGAAAGGGLSTGAITGIAAAAAGAAAGVGVAVSGDDGATGNGGDERNGGEDDGTPDDDDEGGDEEDEAEDGDDEPTPNGAVPAAPAAPRLIAEDGELRVRWEAPTDNGSPIDDYDVRYRAAGTAWTELPDVVKSTATNATISGLTNGTTYEVQVRAGNAAGDGPWSQSAERAPIGIDEAGVRQDRAALMALYNATDGDNWKNKENWNSNKPLDEWYGVRTEQVFARQKGRVTELWLPGNGLRGRIPRQLADLTELWWLWLCCNQLTGTIPRALGNMKRLVSPQLSLNYLTGSIPAPLCEFEPIINPQYREGTYEEVFLPCASATTGMRQETEVSIADARGQEGPGASVAFTVSLNQVPTDQVTVEYATRDASAHAGHDYAATSGTLTFAAGEGSKTLEVEILDDAHDEGEESFVVALSNAIGARLENAEAIGTIDNADPLPAALIARFGRASAEHVMEQVADRMAQPRGHGLQARFAGGELSSKTGSETALRLLSGLGPTAEAHLFPIDSFGAGASRIPQHMGVDGRGLGTRTMQQAHYAPSGGHLLTEADFELNRARDDDVISVWSRSARSTFGGREGALTLNGDVRTTMVGADYTRGRLTAGLSLARSHGLGGYGGGHVGQVAASATGLYPWLGYRVTDRVSVWGVTGYGAGTLRLTPDGAAAIESGLSMAMAAAGTRGEIVGSRAAGGFALAFKSDALWVGTSVDGATGAAGNLAGAEATVTRVRAAIEGSQHFTLGGRVTLAPRGGRRCSSAAAGSCSSVRRSSPASSGAGLRSWCVATCARFAPTCSRRTFNRCGATCRRTGPASSSTAGAPGRCARGSTR